MFADAIWRFFLVPTVRATAGEWPRRLTTGAMASQRRWRSRWTRVRMPRVSEAWRHDYDRDSGKHGSEM